MSPQQEIPVGLSISLTGRLSRQGQQAFQGIQLWRSYINDRGGLSLGAGGRRPIRLIHYDDQSRAGCAQQNARRLLDDDGVAVLLGPYGSALTMAVAQVAEQGSKLLWNHGGASDAIFQRGRRCLVSTLSPASDYLRGLPGWLAKTWPRPRRICLVHSARGSFSSQVARGVAEAAALLGSHSLELMRMSSPLENTAAVVEELRSLGTEVLVMAGSFQDEVQMMRARNLWPEALREVACVAGGVQAFYEEIGPQAEGVMGPSQWEPQVSFAEIRGPDSHWFVRNFQERFGQLPEYTAAGSFALGLVLEECIGKAGSLEDQALRQVAAELDFHTFYGRFRIDPETGAQSGHRVLLTQWRQGRKAVLSNDVRNEEPQMNTDEHG